MDYQNQNNEDENSTFLHTTTKVSKITNNDNAVKHFEPKNESWLSLLTESILLGIPMCLILFSILISNLIIYHFLGKSVSRLHYSAYGMGYTWYACTAFWLAYELSSAIYAFASEAIGQGYPKLVGIYYQRANLILKITCLALSCLQFLCTPVLKLAGYPEDLAYHSGLVAIAYIPALFLTTHFVFMCQFLTACQIIYPVIFIQYVSLIFHYFWCYLFIQYYGLTYYGAVLSICILYITAISLLYAYIYIFDVCNEYWVPWSKDAFKGWDTFLSLSIPLAISILLLFSSAEVCNLMLGSLGQIEASVASIYWNLETLYSESNFGFSCGTCVLFGASLAAGNKEKALKYFIGGYIFMACIDFIITLLLFIFRHSVARYYTSDSEVYNMAISIWGIELLNCLAFALETFIEPILIFVGLQYFKVTIYAIFCYPITFTFAWYFGFHQRYGILGAKSIFCVGYLILGLIFAVRL